MIKRLELLDLDLVKYVVSEAHKLLNNPGVRVYSREALNLLSDAGSRVDLESKVASIPTEMVQRALSTVPPSFYLYNSRGEKAVHYGGDDVQFDPGSTATDIIDYGSPKSRRPVTSDFVRYAKLTEGLPELDAISTALICSDVPEQIADLYRLYLVLLYSTKPIVTGSFRIDTLHVMKDLLATVADGSDLATKPRGIFDVCPSPPLSWSELTCQNLIDCAGHLLPVELVSMPLAGATGPVTLLDSVVQHAAESLSGVVIHQLARAGAPIVWGGSPAIFDMRTGTTPMGAVESIMMDCAYAQVGKYSGLPTHAYAGLSDAKVVDTQAGLESGIGVLLAALARVNMISGAGMLDFEKCFSLEKLVIDHELIGMARRFLRGIEPREELASDVIRQVGIGGNFLSSKHTSRWFKQEHHIPSILIDRDFRKKWEKKGAKDTAWRANRHVEELIDHYEPVELEGNLKERLSSITTRMAQSCGMNKLPPLPD